MFEIHAKNCSLEFIHDNWISTVLVAIFQEKIDSKNRIGEAFRQLIPIVHLLTAVKFTKPNQISVLP